MAYKKELKVGEYITLIDNDPNVKLLKINKIYTVEKIWDGHSYVRLFGIEEFWYQMSIFSTNIKLIRKIKIKELNGK